MARDENKQKAAGSVVAILRKEKCFQLRFFLFFTDRRKREFISSGEFFARSPHISQPEQIFSQHCEAHSGTGKKNRFHKYHIVWIQWSLNNTRRVGSIGNRERSSGVFLAKLGIKFKRVWVKQRAMHALSTATVFATNFLERRWNGKLVCVEPNNSLSPELSSSPKRARRESERRDAVLSVERGATFSSGASAMTGAGRNLLFYQGQTQKDVSPRQHQPKIEIAIKQAKQSADNEMGMIAVAAHFISIALKLARRNDRAVNIIRFG